MQLAHLALVLLSVTSSIPGHPTKPLDERSTELAWLILVQNNETDSGPRRRVVPKSVFIAPNFDRPCPNGMKKVNGVCRTSHELNTVEQLDFLYQKLQLQLGGSINDGPAQFHIPIPRETHDDSNFDSETTERSILSQITTTEVGTTTDITTMTPPQESTTTNTPTTTEWFTTDKQTTTEPIFTTTTTGTTITSTETIIDSTTTEIPQYTAETDSFTTFTVPLVYGDEKTDNFGSPISTDLFGMVNDNDNLQYHDVFASYSRPERDHRYFNHRNRDKNLWKFNPPWRETPDNTVVLVPKRNNDQDSLYRRLLHEQLSYLLRKNR
ncbi:uncharacterized protein [Onthophagus taurus]|uniref:uncharacterized protein n=1 Tax=Onthophagus taurus TaxID=166361 RepID=UPI000C209AC3|nr:uncharacterized protein LOC111426285 [Onthophagus taurus]